jgi:hypothetical protein
MSFVRIYLVGYFLLFFAALFALWQAGALSQVPATWIAVAVGAALGFGILLAIASGPRKVTTSRD